MMKHRSALAISLLAVALVVGACSSDSSDESASTTVPDGGTATTVTTDQGSTATTEAPVPTTTTTTAQEPAITGADLIEQTTPTSGGGTRPLLVWAAIEGASLYFVSMYTETGDPYWAAVTEETQTYVGGPLQIPAGRTGPNVADGYTWVVYAEDADGNLLAVSPKRSIAP